ncbi:Glycosyl transferase family 28 [Hyella patelloides LEGE 07179]|uniref:Glycosyl transferase family 28 n=1 Tax=Hyella patelloides LEGE 07179 TaxID=945734 RepID=A0A563W4R6_9CYAN|nr:glycosyltransferase [Hyella patelloides]VEP18523.1 Glycosyl transferase family 28 [Hyella patelloides LEGE 07179]
MSRIVVTTIGSLGDLHPKIALALELRKRGHIVIFATHKGYQAKIEALGFEFHEMRPDGTDDPSEIARMTDSKTGSEYVVRNWLLPNLRETYTDLLNTARDADFIVAGEIVYAARLVAEKLGIRWASSALQPFSFFSAYDPPVLSVFPFLAKLRPLGVTVNRGAIDFAKSVTKSWAEPIHQLRRELKLPELAGNPLVDDKFSPYLVLAMFSSVLAKPQPDWAANTVMTGFTFYDGDRDRAELTPELQQFLDAGEPPLVFTLGSANVLNPGVFYQESIQAATQLNRRAVLLMGANTLPENLPKDIIATNYAPYSKIFPHACAIVHQGGIGTTAQALRAGRPTLIMPYTYDQPDNAARVKRLGTSRTILRQQYSASRVAKELSELIGDPSHAAKSAEIGRMVQAENGVSVACDAIEKQL